MSAWLDGALEELRKARKLEDTNEAERLPQIGLPSAEPHYAHASALALVSLAASFEKLLESVALETPRPPLP